MINALLLSMMLAISTPALSHQTNPPVVAQEETCYTPADVLMELVTSPEIADQIGVISGEAELSRFKQIIHEVYGVPMENLLFDRVEFYSFDLTIMGPEYESAVWAVVYEGGCSVNAFMEDTDFYNMLPVELFE